MTQTFYIIYKITNQVNGKIYVGCHRTKKLDDDYMGSGSLIKKAILKHGEANFHKEILQVFDTQEEMFEAESSIINEEFVQRNDTYNLTKGGNGSWFAMNNDSEARIVKNKKAAIAMNAICWNDPEFVKRKKVKATETLKRLHKEGKVSAPTFAGMTHRQETKDKIGKANALHQSGEGNSHFGKVWIFNENEQRSIRVPKDEIQQWIDSGWKKGRRLKFD